MKTNTKTEKTTIFVISIQTCRKNSKKYNFNESKQWTFSYRYYSNNLLKYFFYKFYSNSENRFEMLILTTCLYYWSVR